MDTAMAVLVAKPSSCLYSKPLTPSPTPIIKRSINRPQKMPKPVRKLLTLFLVMVSRISEYESISNLILSQFILLNGVIRLSVPLSALLSQP